MLFCRAGLYKQLATLKGLVEEYRDKPDANQSLKGPIVQNLAQSGLDQDCPFRSQTAQALSESQLLTPESAEAVSDEEFTEYVSRIYQYLQVSSCTAILYKNFIHAAWPSFWYQFTPRQYHYSSSAPLTPHCSVSRRMCCLLYCAGQTYGCSCSPSAFCASIHKPFFVCPEDPVVLTVPPGCR